MTPKLHRSFVVRVLYTPLAHTQPGHSPRFVVLDLKTGEEQKFATWEELKGFLQRHWLRRLR